MLLWLIRKEILDHLISLRFAIACVLCFIVILSSLFVRGLDHIQMLDDYYENRTMETAARKRLRNPRQISWRGAYVHQAPNPLKIFVRGTEGAGGLSVRITPRDEREIVASETQNPSALLFPAMDIASFVGVIMSLLAIVFAYDAISGEKERGTLRLLLSYSVPRDTVLLGKWIGGYVTLIVPFVLAMISGAAVVLVQPGISLTGRDWAKFGCISGVALLYIAAVYSAALYVSCLTWKSSTSVILLVTFWMVLVLAIPNLSPYLAQAWLRTRDPAEAEAAKKSAAEEIRRREIRSKMRAYDAKNGFDPDKPWWRQIDRNNPEDRKRLLRRRIYRSECNLRASLLQMRAFARINRAFEHRLDAQIALGRWISRLSPLSCFAMAAMELTDTGMTARRRFLEQIGKHQEVLARYAHAEVSALYEHELVHGSPAPPWGEPGNRKKPFPVFSYTPRSAGDYAKTVALDVSILAGMTVLFFMLSYAAFLRYDVR